jgi:hypothetical protein
VTCEAAAPCCARQPAKCPAARTLSSAYRRADVQEKLGAAFGMRSVPAYTRDLGDLPLTVVTAGADDKGRGQAIWNKLQVSFLTMSSQASQVVVPGSGHHINRDNLDAVAAAITDMVDRVRTDDDPGRPATTGQSGHGQPQ